MMTTAAIVSLVASLAWLVLNWRAMRGAANQAGWSTQTQIQMAFVWLIIIGAVTVLIQRFAG